MLQDKKILTNHHMRKINDLVNRLGASEASLQGAKDRIEELQEEIRNLSDGTEIENLKGKISSLEFDISRTVAKAQDEFSSFLMMNDLDFSRWGRFSDIFDEIEFHSMSAREAIIRFKEEYGDSLTVNNSSGASEDLSIITQKIDELQSSLSGGAGTAGLAVLAESLKSIMESGGTGSADGAVSLVDSLSALVDKDSSSSSEIANLVNSIRMLGSTEVKNNSLTKIKEFFDSLSGNTSLSNLTVLSTISLRGFSDLKISKASLNNLAEYLPKIAENADIQKLTKISKIDFSNFNNLRINKGALESLSSFLGSLPAVNVTTIGSGSNRASRAANSAQKKTLANSALEEENINGWYRTYQEKRMLELDIERSEKEHIEQVQELNRIAAEQKRAEEQENARLAKLAEKEVAEEKKAADKEAAEAKWKLEQQLKEAERQHLKEVAAEEKAAAEQKRAEEQENARNAREAEQAYNKERNDKYSRLSSTVKDYYKSLEEVQKLELKTDSIEDESFRRRVSSYTQLKNEFSELGFSLNERGDALSEISEEQRVANAEKLNVSLEQYNKLYETANRLARENYISQEKNGESLQRTWDKNAAKVHDYITRVRQVISKNKDVLKAADSLDELTKSGDPRHLEDLTRRFAELQLQIRATGADTETWFQKLKKTFGTRVRSLLAGATIGRITMYIRQMYNEVKDIDTAITTLKIVTGESERAMSQYADSIAKSAIKIGASIPDLIDSTTVFARLGYTLEESSKLAEIATAYSKVGDVNIDEASKNLTAIIKAYDIQADQIEGVVDKLIYVGNKFPISSAEIGEGMNNAASALKANGNTLNEALGLLSSANTTVDFCRLSWKHDIRKVA